MPAKKNLMAEAYKTSINGPRCWYQRTPKECKEFVNGLVVEIDKTGQEPNYNRVRDILEREFGVRISQGTRVAAHVRGNCRCSDFA